MLSICRCPAGRGRTAVCSVREPARARPSGTPGDGHRLHGQVEGELRDNYWWGKADDRYDSTTTQWVTTG